MPELPRYVRPPWPTPPRPLPLWPLFIGPLLGSLLTLGLGSEGRGLSRFSPAFGFGSGVFVGLVVVLGIVIARRQFNSRTACVAVATLAVLIWLLRAYPR